MRMILRLPYQLKIDFPDLAYCRVLIRVFPGCTVPPDSLETEFWCIDSRGFSFIRENNTWSSFGAMLHKKGRC